MKNLALVDIFRSGNIVIPIFFLKNIKKLKLNSEEFLFLMYLYNLGDKCLFDPNKYATDLNLELATCMTYIDALTEKGFIDVKVIKNDKNLMEEVVDLEQFFSKVALFEIDERNNDVSESNVYELIEQEFGRTLSPIEYEIIKAWLDNNISEEIITEAVKEATFNGVSNLRYIDKILYEWGKLGVKTAADVEKIRKKRNTKEEVKDVDIDIMDWNWFDDE
ncbi:MAG: DnaD domain protein [Bacilli bacterium]|nr:DnaD domain protein [Bacilli bacterium]